MRIFKSQHKTSRLHQACVTAIVQLGRACIWAENVSKILISIISLSWLPWGLGKPTLLSS